MWRSIVICCLLVAQIREADAQWEKIFLEKGILTVYAVEADPQLVFVGTQKAFWRSSDAGRTWTEVLDMPSHVVDVDFLTSLEGWAVSQSSFSPVWHTTDGGLTWVNKPGLRSGESIETDSKGILYVSSWGEHATFRSTDRGTSWQQVTPTINGVAILNDQKIVAAPFDNTTNYYSSDRGATWLPGDLSFETWQPLAIPNLGIFMTRPESGNPLLKSEDGGATWQEVGRWPPGGTGTLEGDECAIYIQTPNSGIYTSHDLGLSWISLGGPNNKLDTRFAAKGRVIYAGDKEGYLWILRGYDYPVSRLQIGLSDASINFGEVGRCNERSYPLRLRNPFGCSPISIISVEWEKEIPAFDFVHTPENSIAGLREDSVLVRFKSSPPGSYQGRIRIRYEVEGVQRDTQILVEGTSVEAGKTKLSQPSLNFDTVLHCDTKVGVAHIRNESCAPALVTLLNPPGGVFRILEPLSPVTIQPGDSIRVSVLLDDRAPGAKFDFADFRVEPELDPAYVLKLAFEGRVVEASRKLTLSTASIRLDSLSKCATGDTSVLIRFSGICDSVRIDRIELPDGIGLRWPIELPTVLSDGELVSIFIRLDENAVGPLPIRLVGQGIDTTINVVVTRTAAPRRSLELSTNQLDFGNVSICDDTTLSMEILNSGCDTAVITDAQIPPGFTLDGSSLPLTIAPGERVNLKVRSLLDTAGRRTQSTGIVEFESNSDISLPGLALTRGYVYPNVLSLGLRTISARSGGNNETVRLAIAAQEKWNISEDVDFDLIYDADLLSGIGLSRGSIVGEVREPSGLTRQTIRVSAPYDLLLTEVTFVLRLAENATSPVTLEAPRVITSDSDYAGCIASLGGSAVATFEYTFSCGERTLQRVLSGLPPFRIKSIHPNPMTGTLRIETTGTLAHSIRIFDANGKIVQTAGEQSSSSIELEVGDLAPGAYFVKLSSGHAAQLRGFIKN